MFRYIGCATVGFLVAFCVLIIYQGSAWAIAIRATPNPAQLNRAVVFRVNAECAGAFNPPCDVQINYGDGEGWELLGAVNGSKTLTATHVYKRPGTYKVRVRSAPNTGLEGPDPVGILVRVIRLRIERIELYFENNRPEVTLHRNQSPPDLFAEIRFSGSGYLKGYWEVDGLRRHLVFRHLSIGPRAVFKYPQVPPLPTFEPGTHRVRFVITRPPMDIEFPRSVYFVTGEEPLEKAEITLLKPEDKEEVEYKPLVFRWRKTGNVRVYLLDLFSKGERERVFSAYTRQGEYRLGTDVLDTRFVPGNRYLWQVTGFNKEDQVIAQSGFSSFSLSPKEAHLPGQILLVTEETEQGRRVIRNARKKYRFELLEKYFVKTLGVHVHVFFTDHDIFRVIHEMRGKAGVVLAQPNHIFRTLSEPMSDLQGLYEVLDVEALRGDLRGRSAAVGIVDTGVDLEHRDLSGAVSFSANCLDSSEYKGEIHGTAVAGLIAARENGFGIGGIAPRSQVLALRACRQMSAGLPQGECYTSAIVKALDLGLEKGAHIMNLCLGAGTHDKIVSKLLYEGAKTGVLFVAPVGNRPDLREVSFPASHPEVLAVAGIKDDGGLFPNDMLGSDADLCAPCEQILSTLPGGDHNFLSGTSMASSVISGLLALSHEQNPGLRLSDLPNFNGDLNSWAQELLEVDPTKTKTER